MEVSSNLLGSVGNECVVLEALLLFNDKFYGFVHSNNNLPSADSGCNNQVFERVTMKKARSERSRRKDYRITESKFKDVNFFTNIGERLKKKMSNTSPKVSCDNLDTKNNEPAAVESTSSSNEVPNNNIKKRKVKNEKSRKPSKKSKNEVQEEQPELPIAVKEKIEQMEGSDDVKLVIEKVLTKSDVEKDKGRLLIPTSEVVEESVLTPMEKSSLDYGPQSKKERKKIVGMRVSLLDPSLKLWNDMCFKKWRMGKNEVYVFTGGWNGLVEENELKKDQKVQLWSFRRNNDLYFALVKL